jgi:xanthosine utilization system XapX-like protein
MRLARFAVAGLVAGLTAGFVVALLRPPRRAPRMPERLGVVDIRGPVGWGTRPEPVVPGVRTGRVLR